MNIFNQKINFTFNIGDHIYQIGRNIPVVGEVVTEEETYFEGELVGGEGFSSYPFLSLVFGVLEMEKSLALSFWEVILEASG